MAASIGILSLQYVRTLVSSSVRSRTFQQTTLRENTLGGLVQVRYKSRKKKLNIKKAKQEAEPEKYKPRSLKKLKIALLNSEEDQTNILAQTPVDDVWVRKFYPVQKYSLEEAIQRHKSFAQPSMLDNMNGLLYLDMTLDLATKKKTKFLGDIRATVRLPHEFPYGKPPNILVFCKSAEDLELVNSLGIKHAGKPDVVIKMIENGVINPKDFDHVLCSADCASEILAARAHFREKFPQRAKGNLGTDLKAMWDLAFNGYTYSSKKITESVSYLQVPLGLMVQPTEELKENFLAYINSICSHRSPALGPFIKTILVIAPPSPEKFELKAEDYVPGYSKKGSAVDDDDDDEDVAAEATA